MLRTREAGPRVRVAAVIVRDRAVLLVRHAKAGRKYWMLPGGGVDFGENLEETLVRELSEEVGVRIRVGRLLLANDSIPPDKHRHILNLYFSALIVEGDPILGEDPRIDKVQFWPLEELAELEFYPDFTEELLAAIQGKGPEQPVYIGNRWKD